MSRLQDPYLDLGLSDETSSWQLNETTWSHPTKKGLTNAPRRAHEALFKGSVSGKTSNTGGRCGFVAPSK
jgi:hypothetical protein